MENTEFITFNEGEILYTEGDPAQTLYYLESGSVTLYKNYGKENQIKIEDIKEGFFGESAMLPDAVRSETAVIAEITVIQMIPKEDLPEYVRTYPGVPNSILKTISNKIRLLNREYMKVCGCINECVKAEEKGSKKDEMLIKQMKKIVKDIR